MSAPWSSLVPLSLAASIALGCASSNPGAPTGDVDSASDLVRALAARGLAASAGATLPRSAFPFMSVEAQELQVEGAALHAFEYPSTLAAAAAAAGLVNGDQTLLILWADTPRFYRRGDLLVFYVGSDPRVIAALDDLLGPAFLIGEPRIRSRPAG
jgi:hypothetical protein